jgi:hypothetical protein
MKVDKQLLQEQIKFLYSYPWGQDTPAEVVGVINLLEAIEEEDNE